MSIVLKLGELPTAAPLESNGSANDGGSTIESLVVNLDAGGSGALSALLATGYATTRDEVMNKALIDATRRIYESTGRTTEHQDK